MAVVAVLVIVALWWLSTHGKGTAPGRLVAWLALLAVAWVLIGFKDPAEAGSLAQGFVTGISAAASGLASFLGHF